MTADMISESGQITPFQMTKFPENDILASKIEAERRKIQALQNAIREFDGELIKAQNRLLSQGEYQEKLATYYKQRYEGQVEINRQLQAQIRKVLDQTDKERTKVHNASQFGFDLQVDNLSENELQRLLGEMDSARTSLRSDLTDLQWRLDKESQEYTHLEDMISAHRLEMGLSKAVKLKRLTFDPLDPELPLLGPHCLRWAPTAENRGRTASDISYKSSQLVSLPMLTSPANFQLPINALVSSPEPTNQEI